MSGEHHISKGHFSTRAGVIHIVRMLVCPTGSAGDVHPMLGIGLELRRRGHDVTVVTSGYFRSLIEQIGLDFAELGTREQFIEFVEDPDIWDPYKGFISIVRKGVLPSMREQYEIVAAHNEPGRTLIIGSCLGLGARVAHDKLDIPIVTLHLQPAVFWSVIAPPKMPAPMPMGKWIPRWLKRIQYRMVESLMIDRIVCGELNAFRAELNLPPVRRVASRWWHSPQCNIGLFPDWYAPPQPDWPPHTEVTGFPLWDERGVEPLPESLEQFLGGGGPPIVFTPGSAMIHGRQFFEAAIQASQQLDRRALLLTRFPDQLPETLPAGVRHFSYVPFSQVLPRAAAVVHHGGIGTAAQGLAAGVPQLVMPMSHDQPDNAARLEQMGVGEWLKPSKFRPAHVQACLERLLCSADVRQRCREYAGRLAGNDAIAQTCTIIERVAGAR